MINRNSELMLKWARERGYSLPERSGCLNNILGTLGLFLGVVPGCIIFYMGWKKNQQYEKEMRVLMNKWIDEGKPLPMDLSKKKVLVSELSKSDISPEDIYFKDLGFKKFEFKTSMNANEKEVYTKLKNLFNDSEENKNKFESLNITEFHFNESFWGGKELIVKNSIGSKILILTSKLFEKEGIWERIWKYESK